MDQMIHWSDVEMTQGEAIAFGAIMLIACLCTYAPLWARKRKRA